MTRFAVRPGSAYFSTRADPILAPPGLRIGKRVPAQLPKHDPDTGKALPLLRCPYEKLLFADGIIDETAYTTSEASMAGTQHIVKPGDGEILVIMLARRRAGMTHQAFLDRWLDGHASFGLRTAALGYRQLHPHKTPTGGGFDGAGLVFFRDAEHAGTARAAPEIAREATRDEMAFIDHGRSMLAMFRFD